MDVRVCLMMVVVRWGGRWMADQGTKGVARGGVREHHVSVAPHNDPFGGTGSGLPASRASWDGASALTLKGEGGLEGCDRRQGSSLADQNAAILDDPLSCL